MTAASEKQLQAVTFEETKGLTTVNKLMHFQHFLQRDNPFYLGLVFHIAAASEKQH